ncbi:MAG: heat-inducible transcriptional repressor HrcA [Acidobacteriota bacterium]
MRKSGLVFDNRKKELLATIVRTHVATGQPVGSFTLAEKSSEKLSSASIRNTCAELEGEGYLTHPHTSAGRVPTDKGYRYYVDNLIPAKLISKADAARINERLLDEETRISPERFMERASLMLSRLSDNIGIVVSPPIARESLKHINFVRMTDSRILVITVSSAGRVQDRIIRLDADFTQDELNSTARYLMENFHGWTLSEIRDELALRVKEAEALYDRFLRNAILLCTTSVEESDQPDVFIEGASNLLTKPDFGGAGSLRALFKMLEQKSRMVKILDECLESSHRETVAVRIGSENRLTDLRECAIIASPCFYAGGLQAASLGVVGPTRLDYDRLIGIVDYIARLFERTLGQQ